MRSNILESRRSVSQKIEYKAKVPLGLPSNCYSEDYIQLLDDEQKKMLQSQPPLNMDKLLTLVQS